ncbi:MAG: protein kinase [Bifidobacteriaceae bacterium]|nr:protein kinase [Bifidobacteriaceae bacterium]
MKRGRDLTLPQISGLTGGELISRGEDADVFKYYDARTREPLAIKASTRRGGAPSVNRLEHEGKALQVVGQVRGIPGFKGTGKVGDGRHFLVMEFVDGPTLAEAISQRCYPWEPAVRIILAAAETLGVVHQRGLAHRGVAPHSIIIGTKSTMLVGFGAAEAIGSPTAPPPTTNSLPWAAPEVVRNGAVVDIRADVYSLAATLYTMIAGRPPHWDPQKGENDIAERIVAGPPAPLTGHNVPPVLTHVLQKALASDPAGRFVTVAALSGALAGVLAAPGTAMPPSTALGGPRDGAPPPPPPRPLQPVPPPREGPTSGGGRSGPILGGAGRPVGPATEPNIAVQPPLPPPPPMAPAPAAPPGPGFVPAASAQPPLPPASELAAAPPPPPGLAAPGEPQRLASPLAPPTPIVATALVEQAAPPAPVAVVPPGAGGLPPAAPGRGGTMAPVPLVPVPLAPGPLTPAAPTVSARPEAEPAAPTVAYGGPVSNQPQQAPPKTAAPPAAPAEPAPPAGPIAPAVPSLIDVPTRPYDGPMPPPVAPRSVGPAPLTSTPTPGGQPRPAAPVPIAPAPVSGAPVPPPAAQAAPAPAAPAAPSAGAQAAQAAQAAPATQAPAGPASPPVAPVPVQPVPVQQPVAQQPMSPSQMPLAAVIAQPSLTPVTPIRLGAPDATIHSKRKAGTVVLAVVATVAIVAALLGFWWFGREGQPLPGAEGTPAGTSAPPNVVVDSAPSPVEGLVSTDASGNLVFTWVNPDPEDGDLYDWVLLGDSTNAHEQVSAPRVVISEEAEPGQRTCIAVRLLRASGKMSEPALEICTP